MSGLIWKTAEINGNPAHFANFGESRLYVYEKPTRIECWVDGTKLGNYASVDYAKDAAETKAGVPGAVVYVKPKRDPDTYVGGDPGRFSASRDGGPKPPAPGQRAGSFRDEQLARHPIADLSKPPVIEAPKPWASAPTSTAATIGPGSCKCGTKLGRSGKCPRLCEPVADPPPRYTGPMRVGSTHLGRLAAPVDTSGPGWVT